MVAPTASPNRIARSTAPRFATGSTPGSAMSTALACVFGAAPNAVDAPEKIFDRVDELRVGLQADDDFPVQPRRPQAFSARRGRPQMPVGRALELVREVEHSRLGEVVADQLQPDRQPAAPEHRTGIDIAGRPARFGADGIDVVEVHRHGVCDHFADPERDRRRGRADDHVASCLNAAAKSCAIRRRTLLRLQVVGVVVPVREDVGPDEDPPPHLRAEALRARLAVHVGEVRVLGRAMAVAHPVVARQVRRRLGGRDDVVRRDRERARGQRDFDRGRAEPAELGDRRRRPPRGRRRPCLRRSTPLAGRSGRRPAAAPARARSPLSGGRGSSSRARRSPPSR